MKPTITAAALALVSVMEFLSAYPVNAETSNGYLVIEKDGNRIVLENKNEKEVSATENELENLFFLLDKENPESILADWNLHAERETHIVSIVDFVMPGSEEWSEREAAILAANENRPVAVGE